MAPAVRLLGFANVRQPLVRAVAVMMANAIRLVTGISLQSGFLRTSRSRVWIAQLEKRRREQAGSQPVASSEAASVRADRFSDPGQPRRRCGGGRGRCQVWAGW